MYSLLIKKKFLKHHLNIKNKKYLNNNNKYNISFIGIISKEKKTIKLKQLFSIYNYLNINLNKKYKSCKIIFNINKYYKTITNRTKDSRMGGGKGQIKEWISFIKKNDILFKIIVKKNELNNLFIKYLIILFKKSFYKINLKFNIIKHIIND